MKLQTSAVRFRVNLLGIVALAAYGVITLLSFFQAAALWRGHSGAPREVAFFDALINEFPILRLSHLFQSNADVLVSYYVPVAAATLAALLLVLKLSRWRNGLDDSVVALIRRWSYAFAAVSLFAFPLFTQDFWLSAVWGRMVANGLNPYHELFTPELIAGLPLDHFPMPMSYGPAWALLSGAVMALSGDSVLATAILFKLILGATWFAALILVDRITAPRPLIERCIGGVLVGWLPAGVLQTTAEGHNDIVMVALALLWFHLLLRGRWQAPIALVVSALTKYVTAPLFVVDLIASLRLHKLSWRAIAARSIMPGLIGVVVLAMFYRSMQFFEGTSVISEWHFLQPRHAVLAIDKWIPAALIVPLQVAIATVFAAITTYQLVACYKQPTADTMAKASLAIMCAVLFAGIAHLWPWYMVWTLALAALVPTWWLSRFVIGVAILAPFTLVLWWVPLLFDHKEWAAVVLYAGAFLWVAATRPMAGAASSQCTPDTIGEKSFGHP